RRAPPRAPTRRPRSTRTGAFSQPPTRPHLTESGRPNSPLPFAERAPVPDITVLFSNGSTEGRIARKIVSRGRGRAVARDRVVRARPRPGREPRGRARVGPGGGGRRRARAGLRPAPAAAPAAARAGAGQALRGAVVALVPYAAPAGGEFPDDEFVASLDDLQI